MQEEKEETIETFTITENQKLRNEKTQKEYKISIQLITETSLDESISNKLNEDQKIEAVIELKSIHLEWLNIKNIENLEVFSNLTILYLQHNKITKIENLDCLKKLEYLALNDNNIEEVENIRNLHKLEGLNLSNNQIEDIEPNELPTSLQLVSFRNNPVSYDANYRVDIVKQLPFLEMLDDNVITAEERLKIIGKFPQHLVEYSEKMKQFRNKQKMKKEIENSEKYEKSYINPTESDDVKEIREKTRKYVHESQETFKTEIKEQNQNFEQKIKISRKIRNFKQEIENNKEKRMNQITETNEEHNEEN